MKLYCLDAGCVHGAKRIFDKAAPANERTIFPVSIFLIETDNGKNILFDMGVYPGGIRANTASYRYQTKEQTLEHQLFLCDRTPGDIDAVVLSHLHYDHAGYLFLFSDREIYVNRKEYDYAFSVHDGAYCLRDYDVGIKKWRFVNDDEDIFPGVRAIQLPGHSAGHMGLLLRLSAGNVLLPQDAIYAADNDFPKCVEPGIMHDHDAYIRTMKKIKTMREADPHLTILYGHDMHLKKKMAPDYYA